MDDDGPGVAEADDGVDATAHDDATEADDATEDDDAADDALEDDGADRVSVEDLGLPMPVLPEDAALDLLAGGELRLIGQLWVSSNNAMLCVVSSGALEAACIYKPVAGERPLRDFPDGTLARREVAAFAVSRASGWGIVPPTVLRDGPFGPGMIQLWIRSDGETDPVELVVASDPRLRRIAVFDAAINNTDRKAGHLVPVPGGHIYGVDHGVTFSPVPKLRTVLWEWRGQPLDESELGVLHALRAGMEAAMGDDLRALLDPIEVSATARRIDRLLSAGVFPQPDPRWPAMPWPPV